MAQNLTKAAALLKTVYREMLSDMLPTETALYSRMRKMPSTKWAGKDTVEWPFRTGRTNAYGAYAPGMPLPESQHQPTASMKVPVRFEGGRIGIDTPTMKIASGDKGAFKDAWQYEMDMFKVDFIDYKNESLWGDGRGIIGLASAAGSDTTTVSVDSPMGYAGSINGGRFFQPGQRVAILNSAGTAVLCVRQVVSIAEDGDSIEVNLPVSAVQCPDNAILCRAPNLNVAEISKVSYNKEMMGMGGFVDDGTQVNDYFDVNRTTTPIARSTVIPNVGVLNLDVWQQLLDTIAQVGRGKPNEHWMAYDTRRSYLALSVANRNFISNGGPTNIDVGFKGNALDEDPKFGGAPLLCDKDAPYSRIISWDSRYGLNFELTPLEWADEDGAIMSRIDGVDAFEAVARMYGNFCYERPNCSGRLDDIDTNIVVAHVR